MRSVPQSGNNGTFQPRSLAIPLHLMGQISRPRLQTGPHPTPSPPVSFSAQLATQLCRSTFERAGGREVKQMDSAYSACLLVCW